jgi:hypothetical protein
MMCLKRKMLTATIIILLIIVSCSPKNERSFVLLDRIKLDSFPSASAIEFYKDKFYVFGDDAAYLLILDTNFNKLEQIYFDDSTLKRLSIEEKPDIESTTIIKEGDRNYLYALGSFSSRKRQKIIKFSLDSIQDYSFVDYSLTGNEFINVLNIEGSAIVNGELFLANRANNSSKINHIFIEKIDNKLRSSSIPQIIEIKFPESKIATGISGLSYFEEKDILFFTASQEETSDPLIDGSIGNSFLGWIYNFSKTKDSVLKADKLIDLSKADSNFKGSKIESVTVQKYMGNKIQLVLVSDNDDGKSVLYKVEVDVSN